MKTEIKLVGAAFAALAALAITLGVLALTGCASDDGVGPTTLEQCKRAQKIVDAYEAAIASGLHTPSAEETKYAAAAKAVLIMYCGGQGAVAPVDIATRDTVSLSIPRQTERITIPAADGNPRMLYYRKVPFSVLYWPKVGDALTAGPLYSTKGSQYLWMPDNEWLAGGKAPPVMTPIR